MGPGAAEGDNGLLRIVERRKGIARTVGHGAIAVERSFGMIAANQGRRAGE